MFKWLKEKVALAALRQTKLNIRLNTKTLVSIANRAYKNIIVSGGEVNKEDQTRVYKAQKALLADILLGHSDRLALEEIATIVIDASIEEAGGRSQLSGGALRAITHVINSAAESLSMSSPLENPLFSSTMITPFLQGNVRIESGDFDITRFRLVENDALVSVRNDAHLRLVEDIRRLASMPHFEIIAPMTAVELLEGEIPESYLHDYSVDHYLELQKYYNELHIKQIK